MTVCYEVETNFLDTLLNAYETQVSSSMEWGYEQHLFHRAVWGFKKKSLSKIMGGMCLMHNNYYI